MIRLLLVDDHQIVRDGISSLLFGVSNIDIVGECEDGSQVIDFVSKYEVDVVLMDINMRQINGVEATRLLSRQFSEVKVIALTMHREEAYVSQILEAGAVGYVLKNTGKGELVAAINKVYEGGSYFGANVAEIMASRYMPQSESVKPNVPVEDLTKREMEIIQLISQEYTNMEIGEKLFISPRTVDTHRRNLLRKLEVKNSAGLVRYAVKNGLVE